MFLKATEKDIGAVTRIYDAIHSAEENGDAVIGWIRGVYPVRQTAADAAARCIKSSAIRRLPSSPAQRTASPMCSLCCRKTSRLTAALFHEEYKTKLPSLFS